MGKKTDRHSGGDGGRGGLGREDFLLWKAFTRDIDPLEEPDWADWDEMAAPAAPQQNRGETILPTKAAPPSKQTDPSAAVQAPQLDARTDARLRRGQMPVEARLDLHGFTQDAAHRRLNEFVVQAQSAGKRCVLVITGKGLSRGKDDEYAIGILRQKLPLWISMPPLRGLVLKTYPAIQRDGGTGAWYLYLKRDRDY